MATKSRTEKHREDPTKSGGVVYTPPELALFLARQAFDALGDAESVSILDPACGDGELLVAAAEVARSRGIHVQSLVGYDVDAEAVIAAERRLCDDEGADFFCDDFLGCALAFGSDASLFDVGDEVRFDVVISNPPYVRTQTLGADTAAALGRRFGLKGRVDLYHAFAVAMVQALRPGGALGLLCSNKFLTNKAGASMRRLLSSELDLHELVDLGDTRLFEAAVLPVIVSGRRQPPLGLDVRFRSVYEAKPFDGAKVETFDSPLAAIEARSSGLVAGGDRYFFIKDGVLDGSAGPELPWNPVDPDTRKKFEVLRRAEAKELGSLGKIRVGVKTTADPVFIRDDWAELQDDERPELELLHPLLTHHEIQAWSVSEGDRRILYPHRDEDGRARPVDLSDFPKAAAYLETYRDRLAGRSYVAEAGREWFEIWVPQKPALWSRRKVVFPDIAETPRFAVDTSGAVVNGDCYWIVVDDPDLADVVTAVGNSSFCTWFYDAACGNFLYSGRRRFMTQYIERLPIPSPSDELLGAIAECRSDTDQDRLDRVIWSALGLEEPRRDL